MKLAEKRCGEKMEKRKERSGKGVRVKKGPGVVVEPRFEAPLEGWSLSVTKEKKGGMVRIP